ncbi:hypothetical protein cyc_06692 [Cyclospora cayetanensis]|uniref:Uncharacterized protein n=1 Tax=Cyclospora cayetanensis TaxID=88456 RepID=A0A1D3D041_9EIME|nr:hypothetical protein cyc_06692 [Cyclospora cayetanensis]
MSALLADSNSERLIQVFVHGKRQSRCQLTRVAWRAGNTPIGFTLVNKLTPEEACEANLDITGQFCVSCDNAFPIRRSQDREYGPQEEVSPAEATKRKVLEFSATFDVFKLSGASLTEASRIARKLMLVTQTLFKVWLESLVVDLVKGWNGEWYFLQVKAFTLRQSGPRVDAGLEVADTRHAIEDEILDESVKIKGAHLRKQQMPLVQPSVCAMCGLNRSKKALIRMLNHRMMLEAQHHMRKRGVDILFFHQAKRQQLSAESLVCGTCYSLYLAEKELIQLEAELAKETGQLISPDAGKLCFVTGILEAFQGNFPMKDPDLFELLQAFDNSCQSADSAKSVAKLHEGLSDEPSALASDTEILVALKRHENDTGKGSHAEGGESDLSPANGAQGPLIAFRGGEAIQSFHPEGQPHDIVLPAALHQWRIMLFLDSLHDSLAPSTSDRRQKPYVLQLDLFGHTSAVVLPIPDERGIVYIRRMLIFYLFSKNPITAEIFKEEVQLSLHQGDSNRISGGFSSHVSTVRAQSAGTQSSRLCNNAPALQFPSKRQGTGQPVAVGSCFLGRLAGKRSIKYQTNALLFEGNCGRYRLRITLGLHRDMQVPSQYISVVPFRDAFISTTPYCCSCPLPPEWLDCFLTAPNS